MAARKNAKAKADSAEDGVQAHGGEAAEVSDEVTQVVEFAAGIDVAKGFGMVCTRVPGWGGWRRQKVCRANATFSEVTALMDHLVCEGIQRLVLESTSITGGYGITWRRRPGWRCGWSTPVMSSTCRGGPRATGRTA